MNPFKEQAVGKGLLEAHLAAVPTQLRFLLARWLLIDECFMNSAQFRAEMECSIRGAISDTAPYKHSPGVGVQFQTMTCGMRLTNSELSYMLSGIISSCSGAPLKIRQRWTRCERTLH